MPEQALSTIQAYTAMVHFLEAHLARTGSEDVASLLGDLARRTDGTTADPAAWEDWLVAIVSATRICDREV
jgi:hypothetical protein